MCVYIEYVHMHALWHTCGSQRTYGSRDGTPIRLGGKHPYPLSHLAGPALLRFQMISGHILLGDQFLADQISVTITLFFRVVLVRANKAVCRNQQNCGLWSTIVPIEPSSVATCAPCSLTLSLLCPFCLSPALPNFVHSMHTFRLPFSLEYRLFVPCLKDHMISDIAEWTTEPVWASPETFGSV